MVYLFAYLGQGEKSFRTISPGSKLVSFYEAKKQVPVINSTRLSHHILQQKQLSSTRVERLYCLQ